MTLSYLNCRTRVRLSVQPVIIVPAKLRDIYEKSLREEMAEVLVD